jgi:hypothetical protein
VDAGEEVDEDSRGETRRAPGGEVAASYPTSPSHLDHFALRPPPAQPVVVTLSAQLVVFALSARCRHATARPPPRHDPLPTAEQTPALALELALGGSFPGLLRLGRSIMRKKKVRGWGTVEDKQRNEWPGKKERD